MSGPKDVRAGGPDIDRAGRPETVSAAAHDGALENGALDVEVRASRGSFHLDAAFSVRAGETVALLGPNGAGKSTLLAVLAGLVRPQEGRIVLGGTVLDDTARGVHTPAQQRSIGVVFQDLLLFPHLTAIENVAFPLRAAGVPREGALARALALMAELGVEWLADSPPSALSGGEAQRVALARALVGLPRLLLLDEPLSALDLQSRGRIRALLRSVLAEYGGPCLLITHDPVDAMTLADRLVVIENGTVTQQGAVDEVRLAPRSAFVAELVGLNVFIGRLAPLEDGAGELTTPAGAVVVAWPSDAPRAPSDATATLRPADVTLHTVHPESSARNVFAGPILAISLEHDRARVHVGSQPPVQAELTKESVARLELTEGRTVWASFKASAMAVTVG